MRYEKKNPVVAARNEHEVWEQRYQNLINKNKTAR